MNRPLAFALSCRPPFAHTRPSLPTLILRLNLSHFLRPRFPPPATRCYSTPTRSERKSERDLPTERNEAIPHETIVLITETGERKGPISLAEALTTFDHRKSFLRLLPGSQVPPLCKVFPLNAAKAKEEKAAAARRALKEKERAEGANKAAASSAEAPEVVASSTKAEAEETADSGGRAERSPKAPKLRPDVMKEVEIKTVIGANDLQIKLKRVQQFFAKGNRVQFNITAKKDGRPPADLLAEIQKELAPAVCEAPKMGKGKMIAIFHMPTGKSA
ncbi:hypothetical protein BDK51DRAFT_29722 [Blyttiomyces helicus]|uniref:Translation initiation factor 3 N-terminal domain-containing protein n=1 Tax=Blyttiomyces helicus TaxID=388810 RepID=A0A4P9WNU7_9FUNG|nr:hypothetical protein BDK51DRAFT_29722 [Blyttiomyces helicus]|eukprot:RKO92870.1 hypothetical protein BDK51DRAFT_29722 [Blyttiomyces helicus]